MNDNKTWNQQLRLEQLNDAFRPAGPIDQDRLFTGRVVQRDRISAAISTPGQHVVVYGERGIGKTSLAAVTVNSAIQRGLIAVRINCSPDDDFQLVWDAVATQVGEQSKLTPNWNTDWDPYVAGFMEIMGPGSSVLLEPDRVRLALTRLSKATRIVIFFDEYDQVQDDEMSRMMASTIKTLSDHLVNVTIGIVGVARTVEELVVGHQSIQRCLEQVQMPRMSENETEAIVYRGFTELNLDTADNVFGFVNRASLGFPQYAHLLGRSFARCAIVRESNVVELIDLPCALEDAVKGVEQSVRSEYNDAVFSSNRKALYKQVLLACAMAAIDSENFFTPKDLAQNMGFFLGRPVRSDRYNRHLVEFCESRGPILERRGQTKSWRYRFSDPAMPPYVIMLAYIEGLIEFTDQPDPDGSDGRNRGPEQDTGQRRLF